MKTLTIVLVAGIAALVADAASQRGRPQQQRPQPQRPQPQRTMTGRGTPSRGGYNVSRGGSRRGHDRNSREDRLIEAIEEAESLHALRRYLQEAATSRSEDVRMAMVSALESQGGRSASDLAYFIADPSEDVASAAFTAWSSLLDDARGDRRVRAILETADILRGFSGGLWQTPGAPLPAPAPVPVMQPVVTQPVATQPVVTQPVAQPVPVPAVY